MFAAVQTQADTQELCESEIRRHILISFLFNIKKSFFVILGNINKTDLT